MGLELEKLLDRAANGDGRAVDTLVPLVYDELRELAGRLLRARGGAPTLQATALVHEAYLKLAGSSSLDWRSRTHFLAIAARAMHQVVIDHGRGRERAKRGGGWERVTLSEAGRDGAELSVDCAPLNTALDRLREHDARAAEVVIMRFFGGLEERAVAEVLGVSARTVRRDWNMARAWLHCELENPEA